MTDQTRTAAPGSGGAQPTTSRATGDGPGPVAPEAFESRHLGANPGDLKTLLGTIGVGTLAELIDETVPAAIRQREPLALSGLPGPVPESEVLDRLRALVGRNVVSTSLIGMGYTATITPPVIARNVLENPAWYTAYTPYQPEISQGRLEALINFQTMVTELTGLELANASLLDEATAAAEAMVMARRSVRNGSDRFFVHHDTHPQTLAVLRTRAEPVGIELVVGEVTALDAGPVFGALVSLPSSTGALIDPRPVVERVHAAGGLVVAATDLLACTLLTPPGELGIDIAVGSAQRFGVPMGFGGPHAAFIAASASAARALPGRLVGVSTDTEGRPALRLALQTREQHIRREKATSNICTAQVLLANIAGMYAVWHGPDGLRAIAERVHATTTAMAVALVEAGHRLRHDTWFDTLVIDDVDADAVIASAHAAAIDLRRVDDRAVGLTFDETSTLDLVSRVREAIGPGGAEAGPATALGGIPATWRRTSEFLRQAVFHRYRTEHEMLRYLRRLADADLALDRTMIPLGSCTMKLNATTEMVPITWPEISGLHPFGPPDRNEGSRAMIEELERWLAEITGYAAVSVQPNAGSQGELAGLLAIRAYHRSRGDVGRTICLIPSSAHGTNAASAVMAGMQVKVVACNEHGDVDLDDLRAIVSEVGDRLAAIMVTYPSTHGVFEEGIVELCDLVHGAGGQVYVDGANLNALVGLAQPGRFGADVSHLNLHKTFCIPHGGGGPGVGPVAVAAHLAEFLPGHPLDAPGDRAVGAVSAAPHGSAGILPIPWVYIAMMGAEGLTRATELAIANANYVATRLGDAYPVLYRGRSGRVAHECIIDLRPLTRATGVTVDDVAKRLIDHGFHAPTISFPVAGTLMIEPTESEVLAELDRFCDAMLAIRAEIEQVADGVWPIEESPLRRAPHTAEDLLGPWDRPYDRSLGAYPLPGVRRHKYFPPVSRIDAAAGDRNLVCSCEPLEAYASV